MNSEVRAAQAADLGRIVEIERGCESAPHWAVADYVRALAGEGVRRCLLVADHAGNGVVGFAVGKVAAGVGELESVAVSAEARRMGMGRALCEGVLAWCGREGVREVELEMRAGSEGARRLYQELGFAEVGRRAAYYQAPVEDAVLMRWLPGKVR